MLNWRAVDVQMDLVTVVANGIGFMAFPTVGARQALRPRSGEGIH